jgi:outer membrane protein OmpA-like peptidoglycan-associated protein
MATAHHLSLSPLESAVLGALQDHGTGTAVELVAVMLPHLQPSTCDNARLQESLAMALSTLRVLTALATSGYAHSVSPGRFTVTLLGRARLQEHRTRVQSFGKQPARLGLAPGLLASTLALSACSTWLPQHVSGLDVQLGAGMPQYFSQAAPQRFELQQVRRPDGLMAFAVCAQNCEAPTPKVLAIETASPKAVPGSPPTPTGAPPLATVLPPAVARPQSTEMGGTASEQGRAPMPAAHFRVYFRFAASDLGPEGMAAIKAALPELRTMDRVEISAGTDPTGTEEQNARQIAQRQTALKNLLVASGVRAEAIVLMDSAAATGLSIRGMKPRSTEHAEMRQANLVGFLKQSR